MDDKFFNRNLWKDLLVAIIATTISIILTFGTASLVDRFKQKQERRLTALMVMSSIESFARELEETARSWDRLDSIAVWLLRIPVEDVEEMGEDLFEAPVREVFQTPVISHDKTAETIFSSNINTWKNIGSFQFVNNVGDCFSEMNWIEEDYNRTITTLREAQSRIYDNPPSFPGKTLTGKLLRDTYTRQQLLLPNSLKSWLNYSADHLRRKNRKNMTIIGITEQEVLDFTDDLGEKETVEETDADYTEFMKPFPSKDSIDAHLSYARKLDSLLRAGVVRGK